jgi:hypothetical protein
VHEQIVHGLDVAREESHCAYPFLFREHNGAVCCWRSRRNVDCGYHF